MRTIKEWMERKITLNANEIIVEGFDPTLQTLSEWIGKTEQRLNDLENDLNNLRGWKEKINEQNNIY